MEKFEDKGVVHFDVRKLDSIRGIDVETAQELIAEDELLSGDAHTQNMVESEFMIETPEGKKHIDAGDFLYARRAILAMSEAQDSLQKIREINPAAYDAAMVMHSDDTDRIVYH